MIPDVDFKKYYKDMGQRESGRIHKPSRWIDQIAERISRGGKPWGDCLPWTKCDELIRLRPGELSIWGGMSGHKKSMLLGWVMCNLAKNYESPVALASLEMPPEETIFRMARQCTGCDPSVDAVGDFLKWSDERFVIYDELDTVHFQRILGFVYYCAVELGYRHIVIDSLTKCGISPKDSEKGKMFLDKLQWCDKNAVAISTWSLIFASLRTQVKNTYPLNLIFAELARLPTWLTMFSFAGQTRSAPRF